MMYLTVVAVGFIVSQPTQTDCVCSGGNYRVGTTCVPCSKPTEQNNMYEVHCTGLCDLTWGLNCDQPCSTGCFNKRCNRWTGHCIHGCKESYHGKSCNFICSHCEYCDDEGVGCVCSKGFYGDVCENTCPPNCNYNMCTSGGLCKWGCVHGWVGDRCDTNCTHCRYDLPKNYYCLNGWFGPFCNQSCVGRCARDLCYKNGSCIDGCSVGLWGEQCDKPCPVNCLQNSCSPSTGQCVDGCLTGWYGGECERQCPDRCSGVCSSEGVCLSCDPGYTGPHCNTSCPTNCLTCQDSHQCTSCTPGHYGALCTLQCDNCLNGVCDLISGSCTDGCVDSWYGDFCNLVCSDKCKTFIITNDTYKSFTVSRCTHDFGRCSHGCRVGWYGDHCNLTCSRRCVNKRCGLVLHKESVVCTEGCVRGWQGPYCRESEGVPYELIVLCVILSFVCLGLIWALARKTHCKCHRYQGRSKYYLSPVSCSASFIAQTNTTSVTTVPRDHTTTMTTDDDGTYQDSMYSYEPIDLNNDVSVDVAVDQPIRVPHCDDTSNTTSVTAVSRDHNISMTTHDADVTSTYQDSLYGYEAIDFNNDVSDDVAVTTSIVTTPPH